MESLIIWCLISTIVYSTVIYKYFIKIKRIDTLVVALGMFDIVYGIFPLLLLLQWHNSIEISRFVNSFALFDETCVIYLLYHYIYAFIGFIMILIGFFSTKKTSASILTKDINSRELKSIAWISLIIGIISLILWAKAYGTIFDLILQANAVRSGMGSVSNAMAFFKRPASLLLLTSYLFFSMLFKCKMSGLITKFLTFSGLLISVVCSVLYLLANDGRLTTVLFLSGFFYLYIFNKRIRYPKVFLFGLPCVGVASFYLLSYMDSITYFLRFGIWQSELAGESIINKLLHELFFLPLSGQKSMYYNWDNTRSYTLGDDLVTGLFAWFPYSLKPDGFSDVWNINTIQIFGDLNILHGQYPCTLISQCVYDLGLLCVIFICYLFGKSLRLIENFYCKNNYPLAMAIYANFVLIIMRAIPYFSFYDIMMGLFTIFLLLVIKNCVRFTAKN